MRTTLDIAEDVLTLARERARREGKTVGQVVSELARATLSATPGVDQVKSPKVRSGFRPFPKRGGIVTNDLIDALRKGEVD